MRQKTTKTITTLSELVHMFPDADRQLRCYVGPTTHLTTVENELRISLLRAGAKRTQYRIVSRTPDEITFLKGQLICDRHSPDFRVEFETIVVSTETIKAALAR
jgi:hypothetical protein